MANERVRWLGRAEYGLPPRNAGPLNPAGTGAGKRDHFRSEAYSAGAVSFEITSIRPCRNSRGAAMRHGPTLSGEPAVKSQRELHHAREEAAPLPQWMSDTRPNRAGMLIPGLLVALALLAAADGVLSTALELAWL